MCGIVFVMKTDGTLAKKMVWKKYLDQKARGKEGYGFVGIQGNKVIEYHRELTEKEIEKALRRSKADSILFHHRFPTSTGNFIAAAHPIKVSHPSLYYDYYFAHNGVITNPSEIKEKHELLGLDYTTKITKKTISAVEKYSYSVFNDSESLAIELALYLESKIDKPRVLGSIAVIGLRAIKETGEVESYYYGRNLSNPLKFNKNSFATTICSQGGGQDPEPYNLYRMDPATKILTFYEDAVPSYLGYKSTYPKDPAGFYQSDAERNRARQEIQTFLLGDERGVDDNWSGGFRLALPRQMNLGEKRTDELIKSPFGSAEDIIEMGPRPEDMDAFEAEELIDTTHDFISTLHLDQMDAINSGNESLEDEIQVKIDKAEEDLETYTSYYNQLVLENLE